MRVIFIAALAAVWLTVEYPVGGLLFYALVYLHWALNGGRIARLQLGRRASVLFRRV